MLVSLHIDWTAGNCYICAADRGNPPLQVQMLNLLHFSSNYDAIIVMLL